MPPKPKPAPRVKGKRRKKKTPRQLIIRDLDNLVREIVFDRDLQSVPLVYQIKDDILSVKHRGIDQPGHLISRAKIAVRWDLFNVHKQDANDNQLHEYYPEVYTQWFIGQFGSDEYQRLVNDSRVITKYSMDDLETLFMELVEIKKWQETGGRAYFSQRQIISGAWRHG